MRHVDALENDYFLKNQGNCIKGAMQYAEAVCCWEVKAGGGYNPAVVTRMSSHPSITSAPVKELHHVREMIKATLIDDEGCQVLDSVFSGVITSNQI